MSPRRFEGETWWREIDREGALVTLAFGKPGKPGLAQGTLFPSEDEAIAFYDAKIAGYLANGYVELDAGAAAERRAAWGEPMLMAATTPAKEEEKDAERARQREESRRRREERERRREESARRSAERKARLDAHIEARHASHEARRASHEARRTWPAPPRLFERVSTGRRWGVLRQGSTLYVSSPLEGRIDIHNFNSEAEAVAELERAVERVVREGWVPYVPPPEAPAVRIAPRRHLPRILDAERALAVVRRAFVQSARSVQARERWKGTAALDRLLERETAARQPEAEAEVAALLEHACPHDERAHAALVDFWIASKDASAAIDALLALGALVADLPRDRPARLVSGHVHDWQARFTMWRRVRDHLPPGGIAAPSLARSLLAKGPLPLRFAISMAFPSEASLVSALFEEVVAMPRAPSEAAALFASPPDAARARALAEKIDPQDIWHCAPHADDLVDALGEQALDPLSLLLDRAPDDDARASERWRLLHSEISAAIGRVVTERAAAFVEDGLEERDRFPGLVTMALAWPERFVDRVAAAAASGGTAGALATSLLTWMLRKAPELRAKAPGEGARRALHIAAARSRGPAEREPDTSEHVPQALRDPPWRAPPVRVPRPSGPIEPIAYEPRLAWPEGLRDAWIAASPHVLEGKSQVERDAICEERFDAARETRAACDSRLLVEASAPIALAAWQEIEPDRWRLDLPALRAFVATHELAALRGLIALARARPASALAIMLPFGSTELAAAAAHALGDPARKAEARAWLALHGEAAALGLIPALAGPPGEARDRAEIALHLLGAERQAVLAVADRCGAHEIVTHLLDHDPRRRPPALPPLLFDFWDAELLPAPVLRATGRALPLAATDALGEAILLDRPELDELREALDPVSLASFASEIAVRWIAAGADPKDAAALFAIGLFGDDDGARLAADLARAADDQGSLAAAAPPITALERLANKIATLHLAVLARRARSREIRRRAADALERMARGGDVEALVDASVPDLGLDPDGSLALDTGARVFRVGFDEHLRPFVVDPSGARIDALPPREGGDDPEKAAGAELAWRRLRRDASALAAVTVERLEEAMVARRAIDIETFAHNYRDHPLLAHVTRRLVWRSEAGATFRVAEDGTLADEHDATFEIGGARWVRVAHPLELEQAARERWIERFADYEILQPYPQLERPVHRAGEVDLGAYAGRTFARPEELARRGYEPARGALVKTLPWADLSFCVELIQHRPPVPSSTIARALFRSGQDEVPPEQVHPIDLSESIEDLESALRY